MRELSNDNFEALVHQFLLSRFPGAGVGKVEGTGGDRGVDSFMGQLSEGTSIWQSKNFKERIRKVQKDQILASIQSAFRNYRPRRWTLCLPIDLRAQEHEWFQDEVVKPYHDRAVIGLLTASDLMEELSRNRFLRDLFFPDSAVTNTLAIRKIATNSETATSEQQQQLAMQAMQLFLEGKVELEPRLDPVVSLALSRSLVDPLRPRGVSGIGGQRY